MHDTVELTRSTLRKSIFKLQFVCHEVAERLFLGPNL